jgi:hypothetical protein
MIVENSGAYDPVLLRCDGDVMFRWAAIDPAPLGSLLYSGAFGAGGVRVFAGHVPAASGSGTDTLVLAERDEVFAFCFGDGSSGPCPCSNQGIAGGGQGCVNSVGDAARLTGAGEPSLAHDTLVLTSAGEVANSPSIFLQGSAQRAPASFGDGLLCIGQNQVRLFVHAALGNAVSAPQGSDPSISARSAALGDQIASGSMRYYQVYYRDSTANFCPPPLGSSWNVSSASAVLWVQ